MQESMLVSTAPTSSWGLSSWSWGAHEGRMAKQASQASLRQCPLSLFSTRVLLKASWQRFLYHLARAINSSASPSNLSGAMQKETMGQKCTTNVVQTSSNSCNDALVSRALSTSELLIYSANMQPQVMSKYHCKDEIIQVTIHLSVCNYPVLIKTDQPKRWQLQL